MALTETQFTYVLIAIIFSLVLMFVLMFWVSRKYPKKQKKANPMLQGVIVFALFFTLYLIYASLGFRTSEEVKEDTKWIIGAAVVVILFFMIASYLSNKPISAWKLWGYVLEDANKFWDAEPYVGHGHIHGLIGHKVVTTEQSPFLMEQGVRDDTVHVFLGELFCATVFKILAVRNKFTGEDLLMWRNPTANIINELFGEDIISSYKHPLKEYDTQEETIDRKQAQAV